MFGLTPYGKKGTGIARNGDYFDLRSVFDNFFNDSFLPEFFAEGNSIRADIKETDKEFIVEAEIPGVKKEDIKLDLRDDTLSITAEQKYEATEEKDNYLRKERRYGQFTRSFLVRNIKHEEVDAKYENGILKIVLPKNEVAVEKNKKIEIH